MNIKRHFSAITLIVTMAIDCVLLSYALLKVLILDKI